MTRAFRIIVAYNQPLEDAESLDPDSLSEAGVKVEADDVSTALQSLGHMVERLAVRTIEQALHDLKRSKPDLIFNLCEGYQGHTQSEMYLAGLWELLGVPYTGNTPLTLGLAQNKVLTKQLLESNGIATPEYFVCSEPPDESPLAFPLIAKPSAEDASLGITQHSVVSSLADLRENVGHIIRKYKQAALVEKYIPGREFNVSLYGPQPGRALPVSEILFSGFAEDVARITSYEAKWLTDHPLYARTPSFCPAEVDAALRDRIVEVALRSYAILGGRDYGRVDLRVNAAGKIYVLEYNPNPDISREAGFAKAITAAHFEYSEFLEEICNQASQRG
ncbi:D-alanine--D-alanine ligase [bacterium]|nr:D-alanine--D-alanine ligase [bacterium]